MELSLGFSLICVAFFSFFDVFLAFCHVLHAEVGHIQIHDCLRPLPGYFPVALCAVTHCVNVTPSLEPN